MGKASESSFLCEFLNKPFGEKVFCFIFLGFSYGKQMS